MSPSGQRTLPWLTRLWGMTPFSSAPLIHVVCPKCHSSQSVRAPERFDDAVWYLCSNCSYFWDTSSPLTTSIRSFTLELP